MLRNLAHPFVVLATLAALALPAGPARAQVNLSWDDCGTAGVDNKSFACGTTQGDFRLYGSFVAPAGIDRCVGYTVDLAVSYVGNPPLPWWDFAPGGCRAADWSITAAAPVGACLPFVDGPTIALKSASYADTQFGTILRLHGDMQLASVQPVPSDVELYAFTLAFKNSQVNTCQGCCDPVCITFTSMRLFEEDQSSVVLMNPLNSFWVGWQGFVCGIPNAVSAANAVSTGCIPTPTKKPTWGSIKALYR